MRIIGKTDGSGFIVEASAKELANVAGFYWEGDDKCPRLQVGRVLEVGAMYTRLTALKRAESELAGAQTTLRAVADLLDPIRPMIEAANEEQTT